MAPTSWSPFAEDIQELCKIIRRFNPPAKPNENFTTDVGLRVLIQLSQDNSNVVVAKTTLKLSKPTSKNHQTFDSSSSFLKSCHLCKSKLRLDRDIFMYRGDLGFCSVECRNRQIYLDERKETEVSTKKVKSTLRHCQPESDAYCETRALLEQFRQRHDKPRSHQNRRVTLAREVM